MLDLKVGDIAPVSHLPLRTPTLSGSVAPPKGRVFVVLLLGDAEKTSDTGELGQQAVRTLYALGWSHPEHADPRAAPVAVGATT